MEDKSDFWNLEVWGIETRTAPKGYVKSFIMKDWTAVDFPRE